MFTFVLNKQTKMSVRLTVEVGRSFFLMILINVSAVLVIETICVVVNSGRGTVWVTGCGTNTTWTRCRSAPRRRCWSMVRNSARCLPGVADLVSGSTTRVLFYKLLSILIAEIIQGWMISATSQCLILSWVRWKWEILCLEWDSNPYLWLSGPEIWPPDRLPDVTTISTTTCLCSSLPHNIHIFAEICHLFYQEGQICSYIYLT